MACIFCIIYNRSVFPITNKTSCVCGVLEGSTDVSMESGEAATLETTILQIDSLTSTSTIICSSNQSINAEQSLTSVSHQGLFPQGRLGLFVGDTNG